MTIRDLICELCNYNEYLTVKVRTSDTDIDCDDFTDWLDDVYQEGNFIILEGG